MKILNLSERLNTLLSTLSASKKIKQTSIICGGNEAVSTAIFNAFPQSKVLVLSTLKTFEERATSLFDCLQKAQIKPVSIVLDDTAPLSVESVCGLMNAPEDVRAVIVLDYSLFDMALYFCAIKKLHLYEMIDNFIPKRIMANTVFIKNGDNVDLFVSEVERTIILSENSLAGEGVLVNLFAFIGSKILSLTDYRVMGTVMRQPLCAEAFNLARQAVLDTLKLINQKDLPLETLVYNAFLLEIADNLTKGKLLSLSAPSLAEYIYNGRFLGDSGIELLCTSIGLDCYKALFLETYDKTNMPTHYYERAQRLSEMTGILEDNILLSYKQQGNRFAMRHSKIKSLYGDLKAEIESEQKVYKRVVDTYLSLGGKSDYDLTKLEHAILLSGDTPFSINGMSLVRENSITK